MPTGTLELIYDAVDQRTQDIKERLGRIEGELVDLRHEMNQKFSILEQKMDHKFDTLNSRIDQLFSLIVSQRKDSKE